MFINTIKSIWDNGGETLDRYTVVLDVPWRDGSDTYEALAVASEPGAFSQFCEAKPGRHLGKKIKFEDLPLGVVKHLYERLSAPE